MKTKVIRMNPQELDMEGIREAGEILRQGGLVAFPTETVYGLGGNGLDPQASAKIYRAKGRPSDNPLIIHIADMEDLEKIVKEVPESAKKLASVYWPGPLTMIFQKSDIVPYETTGGMDTVAVRMPDHPLAQALMNVSGAQDFMAEIASKNAVSFKEMTELTLIDVLYKFKPENWSALLKQFPDLSSLITSTQGDVDRMNYFLGLNIADSPASIFQTAIAAGSVLMIIAALLVPVLSALTQWLNTKLMSTQNDTQPTSGGAADTMAATMKSMNVMMPIMSAVFCFTLPVGMGIYWIIGAVVRSIQQLVVNKHIDKMDLDDIVKKNIEKANKKRAKKGLPPQKITNTAKLNAKTIDRPQPSKEDRAEKIQNATDYYKNTTKAKPGSLASKAQMVQQYNEKHAKK